MAQAGSGSLDVPLDGERGRAWLRRVPDEDLIPKTAAAGSMIRYLLAGCVGTDWNRFQWLKRNAREPLLRTADRSPGGDEMTDVQDPAQAWSDVAAAWDANADYVDEHSGEATAALLDRLSVHSGDRVLELAPGPGTLGPVLSKLVGPGGSVLVTDIAPGMVEVARRRNASVNNVACDVIDAAAIDRPDASFDVVVSRMGLMFAPIH